MIFIEIRPTHIVDKTPVLNSWLIQKVTSGLLRIKYFCHTNFNPA